MAQLCALTTVAAAVAFAPSSPPLSQCPAFADADEHEHPCECEVSESTGCKGVTPRFNWIIGMCDEPDSSEESPAVGELTPQGGYKCADPMRVNGQRPPGGPRAGPSNVSLRYIAAYQWGNPCEVALAALCNVSLSCNPACVAEHEQQLRSAGCSLSEYTQACSTCSAAMRTARRTYNSVSERCNSLPQEDCKECLGITNMNKMWQSGCTSSDWDAFCERKWSMVPYQLHQKYTSLSASDAAGLSLQCIFVGRGRYSSFNTNAADASVNLGLGKLGQAGGADMWSRGAYTPGVPGLGPPGMLFVISCQVCSQFAWFMLNQATLDRGPDHNKPQCTMHDNCWGAASAGEIDFLETSFWDPNSYNTSGPDGAPNPNLNNSRHYVTSYNGAGRCMPVNNGIRGTQPGLNDPPKISGGVCSTSYFVDDGLPHIYAAVVDRRGATVYRDPEWPGLEATTAAPVLQSAQPKRPRVLTPPCNAGTGSCAINTPACLTDKARHPRLPTPPFGQPDCMETNVPREWGFCNCKQNDEECDAGFPLRRDGSLAAATRSLPETQLAAVSAPLAKLYRFRSSSDRTFSFFCLGSDANTDSSTVWSIACRYCCNITSPDTPSQCYEFKLPNGEPAAGKLCYDPLCDRAKSRSDCAQLKDSWGDPCSEQYDGHTDDFPFCGTTSRGKEDCAQRCSGQPPPPLAPVYCVECPDEMCMRRRIAAGEQFCTDPASCKTTEWPPGHFCVTSLCAAYEEKGQVACEQAGCSWQQDGNRTVTWRDHQGNNRTDWVPRCGIGSVGEKAAQEHCSRPPFPACGTGTNWWDLFDDTGQMWPLQEGNGHDASAASCGPQQPVGCEVVKQAVCDKSVCPYPVGKPACMKHPFICCNHTSASCYVWDSIGGADPAHGGCPDADRHEGWDAERQCAEACGQR